MIVRTLNGVHTFSNQRYLHKQSGATCSFLSEHSPALGQERGYQSKGLMEFLAYYVNLLSYREVEKLTERLQEQPIYTAKQICNKMIAVAQKAKEYMAKPANCVQLCLNFVDTEIDLYDKKQEEVHYFDDGVGVKRQKAHRKPTTAAESSPSPEASKRVQTNIVLLSKPDGTFEHIASNTSLPNAAADLTQRTHAHFSTHFAQQIIPFVAITDGEQGIRKRICTLFGDKAPIILDWYHLRKKIKAQMSRLGLPKAAKEAHISRILDELWHGYAHECLLYLEHELYPSLKPDKRVHLEALWNYLEKHFDELVDYHARYLLCKPIGSGRGEKANDLIIAIRQKNNGTAWSDEGSDTLAALKCLKLNNQWADFWTAA